MAISVSKTRQAEYANYKTQGRQATNRKRKLLRLQKQHPNNEQITKALATIGYRRGVPKTPQWSHSAKYYAMLFKEFKKYSPIELPKIAEKLMFTIKLRAHKDGELIWNS